MYAALVLEQKHFAEPTEILKLLEDPIIDVFFCINCYLCALKTDSFPYVQYKLLQ